MEVSPRSARVQSVERCRGDQHRQDIQRPDGIYRRRLHLIPIDYEIPSPPTLPIGDLIARARRYR
jgi:hypothetical protein